MRRRIGLNRGNGDKQEGLIYPPPRSRLTRFPRLSPVKPHSSVLDRGVFPRSSACSVDQARSERPPARLYGHPVARGEAGLVDRLDRVIRGAGGRAILSRVDARELGAVGREHQQRGIGGDAARQTEPGGLFRFGGRLRRSAQPVDLWKYERRRKRFKELGIMGHLRRELLAGSAPVGAGKRTKICFLPRAASKSSSHDSFATLPAGALTIWLRACDRSALAPGPWTVSPARWAKWRWGPTPETESPPGHFGNLTQGRTTRPCGQVRISLHPAFVVPRGGPNAAITCSRVEPRATSAARGPVSTHIRRQARNTTARAHQSRPT